MTRAGILLVQEEKVAFIERHRGDLHFYTFPGGRVEEGDPLQQKVIRETGGELCLQVMVEQLIAITHFQQTPQYYYRVNVINGKFGQEKGPEMMGLYTAKNGTDQASRLPEKDLLRNDIRPKSLLPVLEKLAPGKCPANYLELEAQD